MSTEVKEILPVERNSWQRRLKSLVLFLVSVWVLPRLVSYSWMRLLIGDSAFLGASESIARVPGYRGQYQRFVFCKWLLRSCGKDVFIGWGTVFSMREASLGDRVYIGRNCNLGFADLRDDVMLADGVIVLSGGREHSSDPSEGAMHDQKQVFKKVTIGQGTWVGTGSVVMESIGRECIIGAGAVVNRRIPDGAIAVGVPAKVVRFREGFSDSQKPDTNVSNV